MSDTVPAACRIEAAASRGDQGVPDLLARFIRHGAFAVGTGALLAIGLPAGAVSIVASCADGSVVIAKQWKDVHCQGAVAIAPGDVPPLGSPYGRGPGAWRAFGSRQEALRERDLEAELSAADECKTPISARGSIGQSCAANGE